MLQWQHTARDFSLAQVHEAPDPQSNLSHTHSAQLLSHTRKHFYYHVIMSSQRISPGALRPAPHNHLTPTHVPEKRSNPNALMEHRSGHRHECSLCELQRARQPQRFVGACKYPSYGMKEPRVRGVHMMTGAQEKTFERV